MAEKIKTALPAHLDLGGAWSIVWDAVDPTTGASVPNVTISETSLHVTGDTGITANAPNPILIAVSP